MSQVVWKQWYTWQATQWALTCINNLRGFNIRKEYRFVVWCNICNATCEMWHSISFSHCAIMALPKSLFTIESIWVKWSYHNSTHFLHHFFIINLKYRFLHLCLFWILLFVPHIIQENWGKLYLFPMRFKEVEVKGFFYLKHVPNNTFHDHNL